MRCEEVRDWMQRDLDSDLNDIERQALTNHLTRCKECAALHHQLQKLSAHLEQLPDVLPSYSLVDAVLPKLQEIDRQREQNRQQHEEEKGTPRRPPGWRGRTFLGGAVAAGLLFALFMANNLFQQGSDQSMDQNMSMEESAGLAESTTLTESEIALDVADQSVSSNDEEVNMMIAPDQGKESNREAGDTAEIMIGTSKPSPDGEYIAEIASAEAKMKLSIRSVQGELIFISREWPGDYQYDLEWKDNRTLTYRLHGKDSTQLWEVTIASDGSSREQLVMKTGNE